MSFTNGQSNRRKATMSIEDKIRGLVARLKATGEPFELIDDAPWVPLVESRLGRKLPPSFRALLLNYSFPEFEIGGVTVFSNLNDGSPMDITIAPFADRHMSPWLVGRGYVQFGRPDTRSYDPVCFDFSSTKDEPPVVVLDHEDILLERRKVRVRQMAPSFIDLIEAGLQSKGDAARSSP
jgi:SMI1/KNR4 family protein SUKH-1